MKILYCNKISTVLHHIKEREAALIYKCASLKPLGGNTVTYSVDNNEKKGGGASNYSVTKLTLFVNIF